MTPEFHGMAALMTQAFRGVDLTPIGNELIERAGKHPGVESAATLLDLSILLHLKGSHDIALSVQAQALQLRQIYTLPAAREPSIRLLAFMTPGD
ncbi:MAG: RimK family alpha-L-glutamate ligase, partial [Betaproteobacteria bacterium]|nr:RimK family alpha-L-glutamate ligase [Betaproteobacteria bacterium]